MDKCISMILSKWFSPIALYELENGSYESLNLIDNQKLSDVFFPITFSVSLFSDCYGKSSFRLKELYTLWFSLK